MHRSDHSGRIRGKLPRPDRHSTTELRGRLDGRVGVEDRVLHPAERRPRLDTQLVTEHLPSALIRGKRFIRLTAATERQPEQFP